MRYDAFYETAAQVLALLMIVLVVEMRMLGRGARSAREAAAYMVVYAASALALAIALGGLAADDPKSSWPVVLIMVAISLQLGLIGGVAARGNKAYAALHRWIYGRDPPEGDRERDAD